MASIPVGASLDGEKQAVLLNFLAQVLGSAPSSPANGQWYVDSSGVWGFRAYNGSAWVNGATDSLLLQGQNSAWHRDRANHSGTQAAATISDLAAVVKAYRLDEFAAPNTSVGMNSQKFTNLAAGTAAGDSVNKAQLDAAIQGISAKYVAAVATTAALPACTYSNGASGVGAKLTGNSNGALSVDSYAVQLNNRVMVKNQAAQEENGLYYVTATGDAGAPFELTRDPAMDQATEFQGLIAVEDLGTAQPTGNNNTLWLCTCPQSITVGTTAVTFTQLNSAVSVSGDGDTIDVTAYVISVIVDGVTILGGSGGVRINPAVVTRKYEETIGDNSATAFNITHNLNNDRPTVQVWRNSDDVLMFGPRVEVVDADEILVTFNTAPGVGAFDVVVQG